MTDRPGGDKLRVALLTREYPPDVYGGAGVHVEYLARELAPFVDVTVHCQGKPRSTAVAHGPWSLLAEANSALQTISTDLSMVAAYVSLAAFGRFVWMLWEFGHQLDPKAPVKVDPFMPVVFGEKQIANFLTCSMPQLGSLCMFTFSCGVWGVTLFYLWRGRREAGSRAVP